MKSLTKEQVAAIAKYDEVVQQLELSKEYAKQFTLISAENEKLKKKQEKKDAQEKYAAELNKVKQILQIQVNIVYSNMFHVIYLLKVKCFLIFVGFASMHEK